VFLRHGICIPLGGRGTSTCVPTFTRLPVLSFHHTCDSIRTEWDSGIDPDDPDESPDPDDPTEFSLNRCFFLPNNFSRIADMIASRIYRNRFQNVIYFIN